MTFVGMDLATVQRGADSMSVQAGELSSLLGQLDGTISNLTALWPGADCDAFQSAWFDHHRPAISAAADELTSRAQWLARQLQDQVEVSGMTMDQVRAITLGVCEEPAGPTTQELLHLAAGANSPLGDVSGGWHRLTDAELIQMGIDPSMLRDPTTGFSASIFRNPDGQVVVSYEGTHQWADAYLGTDGLHLVPGKDFQADVDGAVYLSAQTEEAVALALAVKSAAGADAVTFTGHSLGGRLAAVSSVATGAPAVTFNAAGVSPSELMYAHIAGGGQGPSIGSWIGAHNPFLDSTQEAQAMGIDTSNISNYQGNWDPISRGQQYTPFPDAAGVQHHVQIDFSDPISDHGLDSLDAQID